MLSKKYKNNIDIIQKAMFGLTMNAYSLNCAARISSENLSI